MINIKDILKESSKPVNNFEISYPLIVRLFEFFNENNVNDENLHFMFEKMLELKEKDKILDMKHYKSIIEAIRK